jgi:hypothetical protein
LPIRIDVKEHCRPFLLGNIIALLKVAHGGVSGLEAPFKRARCHLGKSERSIHHPAKVNLLQHGYKTAIFMVNNQ